MKLLKQLVTTPFLFLRDRWIPLCRPMKTPPASPSPLEGIEPKGTDSQTERILDLLHQHHIKVVAFDMDQTAVAQHSHGRLKRGQPLEQYLDRTTPCFKALVPQLHSHGIGLCIATLSDEAEFGGLVQPTTHILGSELARAVVERNFDPSVAAAFLIVAYNPKARGRDGQMEHNRIKRCHMRTIQQHFQVDPESIVFLDDTPQVVDDCRNHCGVRAILVDGRTGFQLSDLLSALVQL